MTHETYMKLALALAEEALSQGNFPVGCVIVHQGKVIAEGRRENTALGVTNEIDHAEIMALRNLAPDLSPEAKGELVLYATMEPCLMCFSAIMLSGIRHIVYAYEDVMGGGTGLDRSSLPPLYSGIELDLVPGILRKESLGLFKRFFLSPGNRYWKGSLLESYTLSAR